MKGLLGYLAFLAAPFAILYVVISLSSDSPEAASKLAAGKNAKQQ